MTPEQLNVIAAIFARSNTGMPLPTVEEVRHLLSLKKNSLSGCVMYLCQQYMESDDHQEMFEDEAKGWRKGKKIQDLETIKKTWPDIGQLITQALEQ